MGQERNRKIELTPIECVCGSVHTPIQGENKCTDKKHIHKKWRQHNKRTKKNKTKRAFYFTHELLYWIVCLLARYGYGRAQLTHCLTGFMRLFYCLQLISNLNVPECARHTFIHFNVHINLPGLTSCDAQQEYGSVRVWLCVHLKIKTIMSVHIGRFKIKQFQHGKF